MLTRVLDTAGQTNLNKGVQRKLRGKRAGGEGPAEGKTSASSKRRQPQAGVEDKNST